VGKVHAGGWELNAVGLLLGAVSIGVSCLFGWRCGLTSV
jgi:hypothetical protein